VEGMNLLEARIILRCRKTTQAKEVWLDLYNFGYEYSYNYIVNKLSQLAALGYLIKREINHGNERGRKTFYTATPQAVVEAMNFIEERMKQLQRSSGNNIASLTSYIVR
jgi:hypothetical protein